MNDYKFVFTSDNDKRIENFKSLKVSNGEGKNMKKIELANDMFKKWKNSSRRVFFVTRKDYHFCQSFQYYLAFGSSFCYAFNGQKKQKTIPEYLVVKTKPNYDTIFGTKRFLYSIMEKFYSDKIFMKKILMTYSITRHENHVEDVEKNHIFFVIDAADIIVISTFVLRSNFHDIMSFCEYIDIPDETKTRYSKLFHINIRSYLRKNDRCEVVKLEKKQ